LAARRASTRTTLRAANDDVEVIDSERCCTPAPSPEDQEMDPNATPKPRLAEEGQIYVTLTAAKAFATKMEMDLTHEIEEARRDLTEIMMQAYRSDGGGVRARIKARGIDLSAIVVREGPLLVVTSIEVRDLITGARGGRRR
jgi:hypothetical protein